MLLPTVAGQQVTVVVPGHGEVQLTMPIDDDFTGKKLVKQLQQHMAELEASAPAGTTTAAATALATAHEEGGVMTAAAAGVEEGTWPSTGPAASEAAGPVNIWVRC